MMQEVRWCHVGKDLPTPVTVSYPRAICQEVAWVRTVGRHLNKTNKGNLAVAVRVFAVHFRCSQTEARNALYRKYRRQFHVTNNNVSHNLRSELRLEMKKEQPAKQLRDNAEV